MYKKILVPLDGSSPGEQAIPFVSLLGSRLKCPVELVRVYEPEPVYYFPGLRDYQEREAAAAQHHEEVRHSLDPIRDSLQEQGITATAVIHEPDPSPHGRNVPREAVIDPAHHIVEEAGKEADTLIMMCTHGRSGVGRWAMGSVTDKVLHATTSPLFVVRGSEEGSTSGEAKIESIIVPLDGSAMAEQALPHAVNLSKALGVKLLLVTSIPSDQSHAHEEDHLRQLGERLVSEGAHSFEARVLHGDPANVIVDLTHEMPTQFLSRHDHPRALRRWPVGLGQRNRPGGALLWRPSPGHPRSLKYRCRATRQTKILGFPVISLRWRSDKERQRSF